MSVSTKVWHGKEWVVGRSVLFYTETSLVQDTLGPEEDDLLHIQSLAGFMPKMNTLVLFLLRK